MTEETEEKEKRKAVTPKPKWREELVRLVEEVMAEGGKAEKKEGKAWIREVVGREKQPTSENRLEQKPNQGKKGGIKGNGQES